MCGFLIESITNNQLLSKERFVELLDRSRKRGPDHQGYWSNGRNAQFGFNRLSIIDLSEAGNQPMLSPNGAFVLVFNGEIYNHAEIRRELRGYNFRGESDTETIAASLEYFGAENTFKKLDGMFALAAIHIQSETLYLARDFAGIKPLFYGWKNGTFVAASQYDQIAAHPQFFNETVNPEVLRLYLQQHHIPSPFGLLEHTYQLEPGQWMKLDRQGRMQLKYFWEFPSFHEPNITNREVAMEYISNELESSVYSEMKSDVPLGAFLSGGIDSPLICNYGSKFQKGLKSFTIGSQSEVHDESVQAGVFANLLQTKHYKEIISDFGSNEILKASLSSMHEPMADFSIIPTYLVSKIARTHVTVALSGDGGDELFMGYERFWSVGKNINFQSWPLPLKWMVYGVDKFRTGNRNINEVLFNNSQGNAHEGLHSRFNANLIEMLFPDLLHKNAPMGWSNYSYPNTSSEMELIQYMRKAEFYGMMQKTLRKVDLASMENSLEVRVPFLKKTFIEASLNVDPFLSYGGGKRKQLLKEILAKKIPGARIDANKKGFTVPLAKWLRNNDMAFAKDLLMDLTFREKYNLNNSALEHLLTRHLSGEDLKWPVFTLMALASWEQNLKG